MNYMSAVCEFGNPQTPVGRRKLKKVLVGRCGASAPKDWEKLGKPRKITEQTVMNAVIVLCYTDGMNIFSENPLTLLVSKIRPIFLQVFHILAKIPGYSQLPQSCCCRFCIFSQNRLISVSV